ncbi:MAG: hypothetical protein NDJ94_18115 [Vicinamibacteria bacterium]|jgi:hypothetical protein|nr:hypothetical protein [Vicinamibacteria bacterium]
MQVRITIDEAAAEQHLGSHLKDGSGIGINYADVYLKPFKLTLEDGRKLLCKRRGLKLTLAIGDRTGEGLMRRLQHGPDERRILREALQEAATAAGATIDFEPGAVILDA